MDPLSVAVSAISIAQYTFNIVHRYNELAEAKNLLLSINISLLRLQKWQKHWFDHGKYDSNKAKAIWSEDGSAQIEELGREINIKISQLNVALSEGERKTMDTSYNYDGIELPPKLINEVEKAFRDMDGRKRGHRRFMRFFKRAMAPSIQSTGGELSVAVDQLEQLSLLRYQMVHGLVSFRIRGSFHEYVARSVVTRQEALNLWDHCRCETFQCSLGIDMLLEKGAITPLHVAVQKSESDAICYRILWTMEKDYAIIRLADMLNAHESNSGVDMKEQVLETHTHELLREERRDRKVVELYSKYCNRPSRFWVTHVEEGIPRPLNNTTPQAYNWQDQVRLLGTDLIASLTRKDRLQLAYKISECGVELLGTPWLALLVYTRLDHVWLQRDRSKMEMLEASLRQLQVPTPNLNKAHLEENLHSEKDIFTLDVPQVPIDDMIVQDSGILAEHNQLFYLGVLLIRLALGREIDDVPKTASKRAAWASKLIPLVSRELGSGYADACTFCVSVYRKGHWESYNCDKYARTDELESWKDYLKHFIANFYSEVYLK